MLQRHLKLAAMPTRPITAADREGDAAGHQARTFLISEQRRRFPFSYLNSIYEEMAIIVQERREADAPRMKPNPSKILEAILLVIETAEKSGRHATQFDIAKSIFLADYRHLLSYGRPITYDNFTAMKFGPVPSMTYDMLKPSFRWSVFSMPKAPWETRQINERMRQYFRPERSANRRKLSETDITALVQAFRDVKAMGFKKTSDFTHNLPAYLEAWNNRGDKKANDMDLRRLLPEFDDEMLSDLEHASLYSA
ncbi:Panacea domain-containing protein [Allosphingosinicella humi]